MAEHAEQKREDGDLGPSLAETLKRSDLAAVATDLGEVSLDLLIDPGVLQEIPIIGTLTGIWKAGRTIRDHLFTKKLLVFLHTLADVPQDQRLKMIEQLEADPAFGKKVGEEVILLLDRLDAVDKAALAGKAFRAYCTEAIDAETLQRFNYAIDRIMLRDLRQLPAFLEKSGSVSSVTKQAFINGGLATVSEGRTSTVVRPEVRLCADLVQHVLQ